MASPDAEPSPRPAVSKKLILCCDGTWQNSISGLFAGTLLAGLYRGTEPLPTNVTRLARAIQPTDRAGRPQITAYQTGIGSAGTLADRLLGGALGKGLADNVREAYSFLAANHVDGDEIHLVGFSRGAYTARSVGGLLSDLGLLTRRGMDHFVDIFADWESTGSDGYTPLLGTHMPEFQLEVTADAGVAYLAAYRAELVRLGLTRAAPVPIQTVAVFDTVGALGIPINPVLQRLGWPNHLRFYRFYDVQLSPNTRHAFQALALDERRSAYRPTLWARAPGVSTELKQVWFPGGHSDVGGGHADMGIANISLAWMVQQLSPWLDFFDDYLPDQLAAQQAYLERTRAPKSARRGWATGQISDSASNFVYALLGRRARRPGRYHRIDRRSDRVELDQPLRDTCESVHASVRSRVASGGLNGRNHLTSYSPAALAPYEVLGAAGPPGATAYRYTGPEKQFAGRILREEPLGDVERAVFGDRIDLGPVDV